MIRTRTDEIRSLTLLNCRSGRERVYEYRDWNAHDLLVTRTRIKWDSGGLAEHPLTMIQEGNQGA